MSLPFNFDPPPKDEGFDSWLSRISNSPAPVPSPRESEAAYVYCWRVTQLIDAGYSERQADALAVSSVDLHSAIDLVRNGCESWRALDILL